MPDLPPKPTAYLLSSRPKFDRIAKICLELLDRAESSRHSGHVSLTISFRDGMAEHVKGEMTTTIRPELPSTPAGYN